MKKLHPCENNIVATRLQDVLNAAGIGCFIKNQGLSGAMGELPINECWPELWLFEEDDFDRALQIVNDTLALSPDTQAAWRCSCGENIEGQFSACWQCGKERS